MVAVTLIPSNADILALSAACLIERPIQAETAMTRVIMPIKMFRPFDLPIHLNAFLTIYIILLLIDSFYNILKSKY